jgi:hypothetical protein
LIQQFQTSGNGIHQLLQQNRKKQLIEYGGDNSILHVILLGFWSWLKEK